jgi:hydrogenase maturation protein HypF
MMGRRNPPGHASWGITSWHEGCYHTCMRRLNGPAIRRRLDLRGQVQGVGFRPYVYRLAGECRLAGYVANSTAGVVIEVEGPAETLQAFEDALVRRLPPLARISQLDRRDIPPQGGQAFHIFRSQGEAGRRGDVTPDAATCSDCLAELFDSADRRHRYPLINCTNCGPRYSIIRSTPYDRPRTTMADFIMCDRCQHEYDEPADRRFHAQPNACPVCGPHLRLCGPGLADAAGDPVQQAARLLRAGRVIAVKGIGGYHLACRADNEDAVSRLRRSKLRDGKPFAVMVPDVPTARRVCRLTPADVEALTSPAAPIVLAAKGADHGLAASVAPGCGDFGVMLPYSPVHHLLFAEGLGPLVMTSGNRADEPLAYQDDHAAEMLGDVANAFLVHNRPIFRPIDDSVVFTFRNDAVPIRRARGYAPLPILLGDLLPTDTPRVLAVGGEWKSTVCLLADGRATLSEHLGDLDHPQAYRHFLQAVDRLQELFDFAPQCIAHDLHPQYRATQYGRSLGLPAVAVQHHHAHVTSVMAEWQQRESVVGIACDGAGYGTDGAVWGCEVLHCRLDGFDRLGHLAYFPLVGGDAAAVETWRPAAALLRQAMPDDWQRFLPPMPDEVLDVFDRQVAAGVNAPPTSSLGRVFDAVACLLGLCARNRHQAEAAMALEAAAGDAPSPAYAYEVNEVAGRLTLSLLPAMAEIAPAARGARPVGETAARFHGTVACMLADAAQLACEMTGLRTVALSGGCFANRRLLARLVELLEQRRLRVLYHRQVPSGDGGLALGQAVVAAARMTKDAT